MKPVNLQLLSFLIFLPFVISSLDVRLPTGILRGITANGTERWLGIRYALPPIGDQRFKAPVPVTKRSNSIIDASQFGNACPQPEDASLNAPIKEDCLFLNVFRPQNTSSDAALPVLFWIHVRQYTTGAASNPLYEPSQILARSVAINKPIIFVSINYRVNTFGFLASSLVSKEDLNAGLLDQRLAMQFVQDNIAAFGGDPTKVTIWGQSAGAGSVQAHFIYPPSKSLFRAGIGNSAVGPFKNSPDASTFDKPNKPFSRLLANTGCSFGPSALECLRAVPFETLLNISNTMVLGTLNMQLWQPAVGPPGSFVPERASRRIKANDFLHIPYIGGTNLNEGKSFSSTLQNLGLSGRAEDEAFVNFIGHLFIDNSTITPDVYRAFLRMYPANDTSLDAPFNTGDSLYDRATAWYGNEMFLAARRLFVGHASALQPTFAYFFTEFIPGNDPARGVAHATELPLLFGHIPEVASIETDFAQKWQEFYINFVNDLNPGEEWPTFSKNGGSLLQLMRDNITVIRDDFDAAKTAFMNTNKILNEFQK
ncbi:alpha/beta-hydrolase [Dendrothele bispora CBS 962.96]|uniref:Carboxylic ester hydrolase n=1 Tax=Dendrothele bispora (strain CBS 962.96) TaxID=1314807 RepID=A0A4S8MEJ8_DENBC|nr:alpha/beta-hydrolase [Dendrothele bispora CBS 962.96]